MSLGKLLNGTLSKIQPAMISTMVAGALVASAAFIPLSAAAQTTTFKVAADVGLVPFFNRSASGQVEGFSYDLVQALSKRMGYEKVEVIDTPFSAIFAGLFSSRYDMIAAPTNVTQERAERVLFSEPYMAGGISFLVKKGTKINALEDLKGKTIAVNNGSFSERWLKDNQEKYGYEVQRFNKNTDAVQAVAIGRAFANLSETPLARWVAKQTPMLETGYSHTTNSNYAFVFRPDDVQLRTKVEHELECMKKDGSLAALHVKWFNVEPDAGSSMTEVFPGYGAPGFKGYDDTPHSNECKPA